MHRLFANVLIACARDALVVWLHRTRCLCAYSLVACAKEVVIVLPERPYRLFAQGPVQVFTTVLDTETLMSVWVLWRGNPLCLRSEAVFLRLLFCRLHRFSESYCRYDSQYYYCTFRGGSFLDFLRDLSHFDVFWQFYSKFVCILMRAFRRCVTWCDS